MRMLSLVVWTLVLVPVVANADPATLREADELIKSGEPTQAVQKLLPLREAEANNTVYHYLLGIAYLDSGHLTSSIAELKRSLALDPRFLQAKAELGRAYVLNGDTLDAYLIFKEVQDAKPPPEAMAGINQYIDQAAQALTPNKKIFGAVMLSLGYDSNVNSGTPATSVTLPIFGGVNAAINPSTNPQHDQFAAIVGYANLQQDLTDKLDLVGSLGVSSSYLFDHDLSDFDTTDVNATAGSQYTLGANQVRALAVFDSYEYLGSHLFTESGVALDYRLLTGGPVELDFNYRDTDLDYNDNYTFYDARRQVYGVALLPSFFGRRMQYAPPIMNVYFGDERPRNVGDDNLGYSLWGIRAGYYDQLFSKTSVILSGGYEDRRYGGPDPVFVDTRHDRQTDLSVNLFYEFAPTWAVGPGIQWIQSASNIEVYAFRRTLYTVTLRKTF